MVSRPGSQRPLSWTIMFNMSIGSACKKHNRWYWLALLFQVLKWILSDVCFCWSSPEFQVRWIGQFLVVRLHCISIGKVDPAFAGGDTAGAGTGCAGAGAGDANAAGCGPAPSGAALLLHEMCVTVHEGETVPSLHGINGSKRIEFGRFAKLFRRKATLGQGLIRYLQKTSLCLSEHFNAISVSQVASHPEEHAAILDHVS